MSDLYGSNLASDHRANKNFKAYKRGETKTWWCPTCQLAVTQATDPIECDDCGGDMTIAPVSVKGKQT